MGQIIGPLNFYLGRGPVNVLFAVRLVLGYT